MPTITVHPSAILESESSFQSVDGSYPLKNAIGQGVDATTYAQWYMVTGGSAITRVLYTFDLSAIPSNATITSVTCQAKCQAQNSSSFRGGNTNLHLYSGSTNMTNTGNQAFGTSAKVVTIPEVSWTREQLKDVRIAVIAARGLIGTSTSYWIRFYGADLTVTYEEPSGQAAYLKRNGIFAPCQKVYKKAGGVWVEQTDLSAAFADGVKYVTK